MKSFVTPVSILVSVTVTPGIMALEASVTVPRISPVFVFCEKAGFGRNTTRQKTQARQNTLLVLNSPKPK